MNINFVCTKDWILQDVPHQIWEATTADGHTTNVLFTRFLHNKILFFLNNFSRCYLSYLSPDFVTLTFTFLGLMLFLFGLYQAVHQKNSLILIPLLLAPLFPLFGFPQNNFYQGLILYAVEAAVILFGIMQVIIIVRRRFHAF